MNLAAWYPLLVVVSLVALLMVTVFAGRILFRVRRQADERVSSERNKADALLEASVNGRVIFTEQLDVVRYNSVAADMGFRGVKTLVSQSRDVVLPEDERAQDERGAQTRDFTMLHPLCKVVKMVLAENKPVIGVEQPLVSMGEKGAGTVWLRVSGWPVVFQGIRHVIISFDDITEAKLMRGKIEEAEIEAARLNTEIQRANAAKGQYFAGMSHEIRTPLNGIVGMTGLLLDTGLTGQQREFAEAIRKSSEALLVVMNDILDISKIEANEFVLDDEAFNLQYCVEEAIRLVVPAAVKKRLEIISQIDAGLFPVWVGDVGRLRQVLVNLIENAIKFTERGEIVVSVSGSPSHDNLFKLEFSVRDTGIGIPPEQQRALFPSAGSLDHAQEARHFGMSGLGLAVSKRLCELMGGNLSVESKGIPGHGSVFRFSVMVRASSDVNITSARTTHTVLADKRILIVDDNATSREQLTRMALAWKMRPTAVASGSGALDWLQGEEPFDVAIIDYDMPVMNGLKLAEATRQIPRRKELFLILLSFLGDRVTGGDRTWIDACLAKPASPCRLLDALENAFSAPVVHSQLTEQLALRHPLRILLAEDNVINQQVAVSLLKKIGYSADVVSDGYEALEAVKKTRYDVILMDVQMPALDGEQATIRIRKEIPPERQPWIVAMTANVMKGDRERYLSDGMNEYIPKPIRGEQLSEVLQKVPPLSTAAASNVAEGERV